MTPQTKEKLPITVLLAAKNEAANLPRCIGALSPAARIIVLDSHSIDATPHIALSYGAELIQFDYGGGYPKKRQWAMDHIPLATPWVFLLDADEVVPDGLWQEIALVVNKPDALDAYLITKGFHFLGQRFENGGFSHSAVLLFKAGKARFETLLEGEPTGMDMEIHERVVVQGQLGRLKTPLIHEDFKGLDAYIDRHNKYSTWEARVRYNYLKTGVYGCETIKPKLFGNSQERRRFLKSIALRVPFEPLFWFFYHYVLRLGFLEGKPGLIASQIRADYIRQVRAKIFELDHKHLKDSL